MPNLFVQPIFSIEGILPSDRARPYLRPGAVLYKKTPREIREESGACGRIRTGDLLITSELLCQLSHTSNFNTFNSENQVLSYHKAYRTSTPIFRVASPFLSGNTQYNHFPE